MSTGAAKKPNVKGGGKVKEVKKETGLGLSHKKEEDFGEWYSEIQPFSIHMYNEMMGSDSNNLVESHKELIKDTEMG